MARRLTSRPLRSSFVVLATLAVLGVTDAPASASDASLRKVVAAQERTVKPVAAAFPEATLELVSVVGRERAASASVDLTSALQRLRKAAVKQQATTPRLKRVRKQYLLAAQGALDGLLAFDRAIEAFDPAAPSKAASSLRAARTQIAAASVRRARAAKAIAVARTA